MVKIFNIGTIRENGIAEINELNGEILKIVIFCQKKLVNVKFTLKSLDDETLCDDYLQNQVTKFYPKNIINVSQEQVFIENYFVFGPLIIELNGLGDSEVIENIAIYYK